MSGVPTPEEVREQLERLLGHPGFEASSRVRNLLRYIVEETLAGRSDRLKGFTVAVEVFGRSTDFDANLDPIVRIQAGRLRRALDHYYLVTGGHDPVVISVPRGGYVPAFSRSSSAVSISKAAAESIFDTVPGLPVGVAVAVLPLRQIPASTEGSYFADGLTEELCSELSRYQDLGVIPCRTAMLQNDVADGHRSLSRTLGARFLLEGSVRRDQNEVKVSARLIDGQEGRQLWAHGYGRPLSPTGLIEIQEEIAREVAVAVGSEYGVISQRIATESRKVAPANLSTYEAILRYYDYEISLDPGTGAECLVALRAALEREPEYGPAWAALSTLMRVAYILDIPGAQDPRGQMAEYARRGATLSPQSQLARGAMGHSHYVLKERGAFLREMEITLQLNPGSPYYVGSAGYLLILAGDGARGRPLLEKAIGMNPCHPGWFNHGLFVDSYLKGDFERAHWETLKAAFGIHFWGPLLRAAVLGQLGRRDEAESAAAELLALVPDFETRARDLTSRPILSETVVDALLDGLRKAGLRPADA